MSSMVVRSSFTEKDMDRWFDENRITEIECLVPDLAGVARGKILPREKFTEDRGMRVPEDVLAMTVNGDKPGDDPTYRAVISAIDHDLILRPDPSTVCLVPWAADSTAQIIHDAFRTNGEPADFVPRTVLRRVLGLYRDKGWEPVVAPELEFYLVAKNADPNMPLAPPVGRSGRAETVRRAYSIDAVNEFDPLFEEIYDYCRASRAARCIFTRACSTPERAATYSATRTARPRALSTITWQACRSTCPPRWPWSHRT